MIPRERFLASKSLDESAWLDARRGGVTATEVALAATPAGFVEAVERRRNPVEVMVNDYMAFGLLWEDFIVDKVAAEHGILANDWLIAGEDRRHLATPDGLSENHQAIGEYKTTGKDWETVQRLPLKYKRQVQWQLHVTGAELCVVAWLLREERDGAFMPAWWEPKWGVVERDEEMISGLVKVAGRLIGEDENGTV